MKNTVDHISEKAGFPPGALVTVGVNDSLPSNFSVYQIGAGQTIANTYTQLSESLLKQTPDTFLWIDVQGLSAYESLHILFDTLQIPILLQEDILNTRHRPKIEIVEGCLLILTKRLSTGHNGRVYSEHVVLLQGKDFILSLQPPAHDTFAAARERVLRSELTERGMLFYTLLDNLIDSYFSAFEHLHKRIDKLETVLLNHDAPSPQEGLTALKHDISLARRIIIPMKQFITILRFNRAKFFSDNLTPYLNDLFDHIEQLAESCDIYQESIVLLLQVNTENINLRTNEIMKRLTLISTVFLPLTFVTGIYGMNFTYMPELQSPWAYPLCLAFMAVIALFLYFSFKRRNWL